jgi:hypothetical protein
MAHTVSAGLSPRKPIKSLANQSEMCGVQTGRGADFSPSVSTPLPLPFHQCCVIIQSSYHRRHVT